ncbi:MAG: hypothetical protein IT555_14470 [Acetobacteraceae bacterium]|nr:hypothetical protein [Acetobacteraceae bacterium]
MASPSLTAAAAITAFGAGTLPAGSIIADTARTIAANIDALLPLANSGLLTGIALRNGGRPTMVVTPAQATADAAVLALVTSPYVMTQRLTAAQAAGPTLSAGFEGFGVWDTAANIAANLADIEALWRTGTLNAVRLEDSTPPPNFALSAAQVAANIDALRLIGSPFAITLTDAGTPKITLPVWADSEANYSQVIANIASPFTLEINGVMRPTRVAGIIAGINRSGNFETSVPANPIAPFGTTSTALLPANLTVQDYQGKISSFIESLQLAAAAGKLTAILMRDAGVQVLSLTPAQLTASAQAVALFSPNVQLSQIITATQAASPTLDSRFFNFTVQDSVANILANIPAIDALMRAGQLAKLRFTEATPNLQLTAAQLGQAALVLGQAYEDAQSIQLTDLGTPTITIAAAVLANSNVRSNVLNLIAGPFKLVVTGAISAGTAATIVSENNRVLASLDVGGVRIADSGANIGTNIAALTTMGAKVAAIDLLNTGVASLGISIGTATANAATLARITSPYVNATPTATPVTLTAAQLLAQLATLEASARAGTLGTVTLSDAGVPALGMTTAQLVANMEALVKIAGSYTITLSDTGDWNFQAWQMSSGAANVLNHTTPIGSPTLAISGAINAATATVIAQNAGAGSTISPKLQIRDFASNVATNIAGIQTLAAAGFLGGITLIDNGGVGRVILTAAQAAAAPDALAAITSPHALVLSVTAAQALTATVPSGDFDSLHVNDTLANIAANLAGLEKLAANGTITGITYTGTVLNLPAAQVGAHAELLLRLGTGYTINLTDGGTPTIALQEWQLAGNIATLLNRIASPYTLAIDGPIRAQRASTLVAAGATIYTKLVPNSLQIRDYPTSFRGRMDDLLTLVTAGKIASIDTRGGQPPFSLNDGDPTTYAALLARINTPYTLSQYITVAQIAGASLAAPFQSFTVYDSVANILAGLSQVQALAAAGTLGRLQFSDAAPRITTTAATLMSGLDAFAQQDSGGYPVVLTDAGTPTLTVPAHLLGDWYIRNDVLDAIATPWSLQVSGTVTAATAAAVAAEDNNVKSHLAGTMAVADYSFNIQPFLDHLQVMQDAGRIATLDLLDGAVPTFTLTSAQASQDNATLSLIQQAYVIKTESGGTARATLAQFGQLALTGFDASWSIDLRDRPFTPANVSFVRDGTSNTLQIAENGTPLGTAGLVPASGTAYDSTSFYMEDDGTGGTLIKASAAPIAVTDTTTSTSFVTGGAFYSGAVGYLQRQFINPTGDSVNVAANIPNVFLHGGGVVGGNALQVLSGNNVLDGGTGSNFLVGGTGSGPGQTDTFFLDGRGGGVSWGTVVNFHQGDAVTFWGWKDGTTNFDWFASAGASGFEGATIHARLNGGAGAYDASITFAHIDLATAKNFTMLTGDSGGNKYAYFLFS